MTFLFRGDGGLCVDLVGAVGVAFVVGVAVESVVGAEVEVGGGEVGFVDGVDDDDATVLLVLEPIAPLFAEVVEAAVGFGAVVVLVVAGVAVVADVRGCFVPATA